MSLELARIFRRIQNMVRPAKSSAPPIEHGVIQRVQVRFSQHEARELNSMQHYGFASSMPVGSDVMIINVAGDNSNGDVIASNHQSHRPRNMSVGEVVIYNEVGTRIQVKGGEVNITAASKVSITSPEVTMSGRLTVAQDIVSTSGDVKAGSISLKQHRHTGVQSGGSQTGLPT